MSEAALDLPEPRDLRGTSDEERAELARSLYARLGPRVLELGLRYHGGRRADAEDLVAETFARVLVALPRFEGGSSYATWIFRIAMNVIVDSLRRPRAEPLEQEPLGDTPTVESALERSERSAIVDRALRSLGPAHRMVLSLVAMEGMRSRDAAELLGIPEGTLWSRYSRARIALAERLEGLRPD